MPITREQIESIDTIILLERGPGASSTASPMSFGDVEQVKRLALVGLDHAADARLGATLARFFRDLDDVDREKFYDRLTSYYSGEAADLINELDAIDLTTIDEQADAVRGEGR